MDSMDILLFVITFLIGWNLRNTFKSYKERNDDPIRMWVFKTDLTFTVIGALIMVVLPCSLHS